MSYAHHFTFHISHFTLISHISFNIADKPENCKMPNDKLLKTVSRKLKTGGGYE